MNTLKRIGFACKWIDTPDQVNGIKPTDPAKIFNTGTTTVAWLDRQPREVAEQRLWDLVEGNIESIRKLVERVGNLDESLRMVRLGSDILPVYTHDSWRYFYSKPDVRAVCEDGFSCIGEIARNRNVRLSFHPGQFTVLASDNPGIVDRSIEEFEYHADMARWMGYGRTFQDFKCNVHIAGRLGPQGIVEAYKRLTPEARNILTIENEEMKHGLDDCLVLADHGIPIVLDIHHHYIREGEYISPSDPRVQRVVDSWRGLRPTIHYSVSREDYLVDHADNILPDHAKLLADGYKKSKLRAHSDFYWNSAVNDWALSHLEWADILAESKGKNLSSLQLFNQAKKAGFL